MPAATTAAARAGASVLASSAAGNNFFLVKLADYKFLVRCARPSQDYSTKTNEINSDREVSNYSSLPHPLCYFVLPAAGERGVTGALLITLL